MKEFANSELVPQSLPSITYDERLRDFGLPFSFQINTEAFARFMQDELALQPEQISHLRIWVTPDMPTRDVANPDKPDEVEKDVLIGGNVMADRTEDGFRQMNIYVGAHIATFHSTKTLLSFYSAIAKSGQSMSDLPLSFIDNSMEQYVHTKRLPQYLRTADRERVDTFLNKFLARKFADQIAEVLAHEAAHLTTIDELESTNSQWRRILKLTKMAGYSPIPLTISSAVAVFLHKPEVAYGFLFTALLATGTSRIFLMKANEKIDLALAIHKKSEEEAQVVEHSSGKHLITLIDIEIPQ